MTVRVESGWGCEDGVGESVGRRERWNKPKVCPHVDETSNRN